MSEVAAIIADLVRAGVDPDLIGRTAAALASRDPAIVVDAQAERRREKDRERKRLRNSAESAEKVSPLCPPNKDTPTPPEINPPYIPPSQPRCSTRDMLDGREGDLLDALGVTDETKTPGLLVLSEPIRWVAAGCDIDLDIIPALRSIAARGRTVKSWAYCSDAVFEARDRRLAPAPAVQSRPGTSPPLPRKPRNAGEAARLELIRRGEYPDATSYLTGPENESDRNTGFAGTDIARRIALASGG